LPLFAFLNLLLKVHFKYCTNKCVVWFVTIMYEYVLIVYKISIHALSHMPHKDFWFKKAIQLTCWMISISNRKLSPNFLVIILFWYTYTAIKHLLFFYKKKSVFLRYQAFPSRNPGKVAVQSKIFPVLLTGDNCIQLPKNGAFNASNHNDYLELCLQSWWYQDF